MSEGNFMSNQSTEDGPEIPDTPSEQLNSSLRRLREALQRIELPRFELPESLIKENDQVSQRFKEALRPVIDSLTWVAPNFLESFQQAQEAVVSLSNKGWCLTPTETLAFSSEANKVLEQQGGVLPTGARDSRFSMAYSHP
jgi:hypothetical protein